jgi:hypothetical protein
VTERGYHYGDLVVLRACMRATGRDRVIATAGAFPDVNVVGVSGLYGRWVVLRRFSDYRGDPCYGVGQSTVDARTGRRARTFRDSVCPGEEDPRLVQSDDPLAVTSRGIPAWIAGDRLLTAAPGGIAEIDRGNLAGLRPNGEAIEWTHDGMPRSALLP